MTISPLPWRAHGRQHGLRHVDQPEHVGLEHLPHGVVLAFLDGGKVAVAGVVDENVDAAEALERPGHRIRHLFRPGDVQGHDQRALGMDGRDVLDLRRVARRDHGAPAAFEHQPGQLAAEPGGTAGDQPHRCIAIHHVGKSRDDREQQGYCGGGKAAREGSSPPRRHDPGGVGGAFSR